MAAERIDPVQALQAWRDAGADGMDRVRFDLMQALQRRAAGHGGAAAVQLQARLDTLVQAYAGDLARWQRPSPVEAEAATLATAAAGALPAGTLGALVQRLAAARAGIATVSGSVPAADADAHDAGIAGAALGPMQALQESRLTWARLRTGSQLRQSLEQVDEDAGPLNSSRLVHRALTLMQQCAPGYLEHFVAYVDALSSLESLRAATAPDARAPAAGASKPARTRARRRRAGTADASAPDA